MNIILELVIGFLKVGCFSFGGAYAAIPLIRDIVMSYGWLDDEMLTDMIAVSESTPGPIMVNLATYVGASQAGIVGSAAATLAVVFPAFAIVILITSLMAHVIDNRYVKAALHGVKPAMIGIIIATGLRMAFVNLFSDSANIGVSSFDTKALILTAILAAIYFLPRIIGNITKKKTKGLSPLMLIALSAVVGIIFC